jgi:hypothetical protein
MKSAVMRSPKQITVRAGAFKTHMRVFFGERVNQHPIRLDMAIAAANKISAQRMFLEFRRQRFAFNQQFQHRLELRHVLAALVRAFDIFFELAVALKVLTRPGRQRVPFCCQTVLHFARLAGVERAGGERIWNPHVKGQAALQFDLPVKQMHRLGSRQSQLGEDVFNFVLEAGFDAGADGRGFAHAVNVALLLPHDKWHLRDGKFLHSLHQKRNPVRTGLVSI